MTKFEEWWHEYGSGMRPHVYGPDITTHEDTEEFVERVAEAAWKNSKRINSKNNKMDKKKIKNMIAAALDARGNNSARIKSIETAWVETSKKIPLETIKIEFYEEEQIAPYSRDFVTGYNHALGIAKNCEHVSEIIKMKNLDISHYYLNKSTNNG